MLQNHLREEEILPLEIHFGMSLNFLLHKRPLSAYSLNLPKKGSLRKHLKSNPFNGHLRLKDSILSDAIEGERSHLEDNLIFSPSTPTFDDSFEPIFKPIPEPNNFYYALSLEPPDDPMNLFRHPMHKSHQDHKEDREEQHQWLEGIKNPCPFTIEWMDKEEALMDSDFGSISNGEFLTPFEDEIHQTTEEGIGETNLGETPNIQIGDEDNINEHGIYFIATSLTPCSYATSSQSIGLSNITTFENSSPLFLSIYKNFKRMVVDAYVYNKYCRSRGVDLDIGQRWKGNHFADIN